MEIAVSWPTKNVQFSNFVMSQLRLPMRGRSQGMGAKQIYQTLKAQIVDGVYGLDGPLPSSRGLAAELKVSRTTVTAAYEQLAAEGFIDMRQGTWPRVVAAVINRDHRPGPARPRAIVRLSAYGERLRTFRIRLEETSLHAAIQFRYGDLAPSDFPVLAWKRAIVAAIMQQPARLAYDDPRGRGDCALLCRAISGALGPCDAI
ncbi:GntR family transcriptional regulator [Mesorhizobium kowhaii]|uniref:GntR family transcriptional regulator n=1 Tax=Mesorhizobium kowhaii TaxID=1300272 RepID=UPI0035EE6E44